MKIAPERDKLHFSDLRYIYICMYASYMVHLIEILRSVTSGP